MDLMTNASLDELASLLKSLGYRVRPGYGHLSAVRREGLGRIHVLAAATREGAYLDIHWEAPVHLLMLGVDYRRRPARACAEVIAELRRRGRRCVAVGGTSWFTRRNKAVLRGIRI
ncbi:hypothetical protein B6U99_00665 [Candidatus Geothermarchaeota archaeon ex4572_27]|nr:MAG: hypothetical protein B6U99_00665 [Candidatus Geothermarchaeota archaeon ex4572_27]